MANTYLTRTPSSTGNRRILTISCWFKRSNISSTQTLFANGGNSSNRDYIVFESNQLVVARYDGGYQYQIKLNRLFRDTSAWTHLVVAFNTTEDSSDNRIKIYINGVRETSFATNTRPTLNRDTWYNYSGKLQNIGVDYDNAGNDFNGLMSHVHWCDGAALAPTVFGETDSTTGEWKIKTSPSFTPGTNGFTILKDGNTITDQSANSNNFSLGGGTLTKTEDSPSNVFATMNPLAKFRSGATITEGNNTVAMTTSKAGVLSTIGIPNNKGKFYVELKMATLADSSRFHFGLLPFECEVADDPINTTNLGIMLSGYNAAIYAGGGNINAFYGGTGRFNSFTGILGMAVDLTSATKTIAFSKDGLWITGSNTTNASYSNALKVDITSYLSISSDWHVGVGSGNSSGTTGVYKMNFGNGYFGTTAVSSAGTNASGNGIFEYNVPSGYTALSTKGLNT